MSEFPWFRFYNETVSDRKMLRVCRDCGQPKALVIGVWAILLSLASESPQRGELLISDDLPLNPDEIRDETGLDVTTFEAIISGLVVYGLIDTSGECWSICNWDKRQPASDSSAERVRQHRQRKRDNGQVLPGDTVTVSVTTGETLPKRYSNGIDKDKDKDKEREKNARETKRQPAVSSPPPQVVYQSSNRTPGKPLQITPPEPEPITPKEQTHERLAVAELADAITDVTGVSARLNWDKVGGLAIELQELGYTPEQIRTHYSKQRVAGTWNWYEKDWRGKRDDLPTPATIRETIAGATQQQTAAPVKQPSVIDRALAMFPTSGKPATT